MVRDLLLCVSFCHSTFPLCASDRWMGLIGVCATIASLKAHDMRPLSLPRGTELRKLWGLPLTIAGCGLRCIRPFLRTLSLPFVTPEYFFLKFLSLVECLME